LQLGRWTAYLVVFLSSACTLILEIVAGRILAPYIGVSLYTWTSIIGVVLAGISLGNYAGGKIADRWSSPRTLGIILLIGGLCSLLVLPRVPLAGDPTLLRPDCSPDGFGWLGSLCSPQVATMGRILSLTAAIFFLPGFVLGMVSPVVVRLSLRSLTTSGGTVGRIYAWSTLGSILGTFLAGFWLISAFGTRQVVLGVGLLLVGLAVVFGQLWRVRRPIEALPLLTGSLLLVLLLNQIQQRGVLSSGCYRETDYFCLKVYQLGHERGEFIRVLQLDHLVHSYSALDDPTYYEYSYIRIYAELVDYVARERPDFRALFVGGGGYTLPRGLEAQYPRAAIEVVEIDPAVTTVAYERMGLPPDSRVVSYNQDARLVLAGFQDGRKYDLVFGDAFNDISVPYHLTTFEFDRNVRQLLRDDGFYLMNVIDRFNGGGFLASVVRTLREVFPHVHLLAAGEPWRSPSSSPSTYVVVAGASPLDLQRLDQVQAQGVAGRRLGQVMPQDAMEEWLRQAPSVLLTDDYAPTDNLLAPLFAERGR
jgi:spermidine synthase/MFS family permease